MLSYTYDAWGNATVSGNTSLPANKNPFRYRGYYYDADLDLYYLNSRYYDSRTGRFLNVDDSLYHSMLGYNMFVYCYNNPVNYYDPTGEIADSLIGWWNSVSTTAGTTPTWVDDVLVLAGGIILGILLVEEFETGTTYYNPMLDWEYQQSLIVDYVKPPQTIVQDTGTPSNESTIYEIKAKEVVDPHRRENQKKQGRELKPKARRNDDFEDRSNKRHGREKPKKHTPARDHSKNSKSKKKTKIF